MMSFYIHLSINANCLRETLCILQVPNLMQLWLYNPVETPAKGLFQTHRYNCTPGSQGCITQISTHNEGPNTDASILKTTSCRHSNNTLHIVTGCVSVERLLLENSLVGELTTFGVLGHYNYTARAPCSVLRAPGSEESVSGGDFSALNSLITPYLEPSGKCH